MSQVSVFMNNSLDKDSANYKQDTGMYWPIQYSETVNSCYQLCTKFPSYANTVSNWLNNTRTVKIEHKIWTLRCTSWSRKIIQNKTIRYWLTSIFCKNLSEHLRKGTLDQDEVKNIIKMPSLVKFHITNCKLWECGFRSFYMISIFLNFWWPSTNVRSYSLGPACTQPRVVRCCPKRNLFLRIN